MPIPEILRNAILSNDQNYSFDIDSTSNPIDVRSHVDDLDEHGSNMLHIAIEANSRHWILGLIFIGVKIDHPNTTNTTALQLAIRKKIDSDLIMIMQHQTNKINTIIPNKEFAEKLVQTRLFEFEKMQSVYLKYGHTKENLRDYGYFSKVLELSYTELKYQEWLDIHLELCLFVNTTPCINEINKQILYRLNGKIFAPSSDVRNNSPAVVAPKFQWSFSHSILERIQADIEGHRGNTNTQPRVSSSETDYNKIISEAIATAQVENGQFVSSNQTNEPEKLTGKVDALLFNYTSANNKLAKARNNNSSSSASSHPTENTHKANTHLIISYDDPVYINNFGMALKAKTLALIERLCSEDFVTLQKNFKAISSLQQFKGYYNVQSKEDDIINILSKDGNMIKEFAKQLEQFEQKYGFSEITFEKPLIEEVGYSNMAHAPLQKICDELNHMRQILKLLGYPNDNPERGLQPTSLKKLGLH